MGFIQFEIRLDFFIYSDTGAICCWPIKIFYGFFGKSSMFLILAHADYVANLICCKGLQLVISGILDVRHASVHRKLTKIRIIRIK